jgi:hypothetical protein
MCDSLVTDLIRGAKGHPLVLIDDGKDRGIVTTLKTKRFVVGVVDLNDPMWD